MIGNLLKRSYGARRVRMTSKMGNKDYYKGSNGAKAFRKRNGIGRKMDTNWEVHSGSRKGSSIYSSPKS